MVQDATTITLEHWNASEYANHAEVSVAGMDAAIRLLCSEFVNGYGKRCGAHFFDIGYFITEDTGERLCRVQCNACSKVKTRKLGTLVGDHE